MRLPTTKHREFAAVSKPAIKKVLGQSEDFPTWRFARSHAQVTGHRPPAWGVNRR
jgi:hypothetical protein